MIPDHLIDKAIRAMIIFERKDPDDPCERWKFDSYDHGVRVTLEAVAADIWDEGHRTRVQRGPDGCTCNAWNEDECGCGEYGTGPIITPNPYKASEDA